MSGGQVSSGVPFEPATRWSAVCSSSEARLATQMRVGRFSTRQKSIVRTLWPLHTGAT